MSARFCGRGTNNVMADCLAERVYLAQGGLDRYWRSSIPGRRGIEMRKRCAEGHGDGPVRARYQW